MNRGPAMMTTEEILALAPRIAARNLPRPSYYSIEDVQQDACMILLQQQYPADSPVPEIAWRFRDATNKLRNYLKHKTRFESDYTETANPVHDPASEERIDARAALDAVGLTPHEKAVTLARFEEGLTEAEIAVRFNCCRQAIHQTLRASQVKLRGYFDEDYLCPRPIQPTDGVRRRRAKARRGALALASGA